MYYWICSQANQGNPPTSNLWSYGGFAWIFSVLVTPMVVEFLFWAAHNFYFRFANFLTLVTRFEYFDV